MVKQPHVKTAAAVLIAGAAVTLAACSPGTSSSSASKAGAPRTTSPATSPSAHSGSPMTNQGMCKHVDALRTSLQDLTHLNLGMSSASKIRTDLTDIQTHLAELKSHGGSSALSTQVNQLSTSVDKVQKAADGMSTPPTTSQITAVVTSLTQLKAQSKTALAAMDAACPR
jgi:hypothetical protein